MRRMTLAWPVVSAVLASLSVACAQGPRTASSAVLAAGAVTVAGGVTIDAAAGRHPISPLIYGVAFADAAALKDLNAPLNRSGGNATTQYNWKLNAGNRGQDWFYESIGDESSTPGASVDKFIADSNGAGAQAMITIPMIGWVAKLGPDRAKLASFSIAKYGPQQKTDPYMPDAGNGKHTDGSDVTGNDPNDANTPADPAFQQGWVEHLVQKWGGSLHGGLKYYLMDNEPSIWQGTHRDVHPTGPKMEEIRDDIIKYATMVKSVDPGAQIVAPEEWGWSGYLYSGFDQQSGNAHGWNNLPDRAAHGGEDYLPWLLDQLRQHDQATGKRLLDVFSVHYYPQGGEGGNDTSRDVQLKRNRSTRSLWDPNYVDESWIHDKVALIPRLKGWVAQHYPGTKIGITEYNWGAEDHINGATTQADILGIFGREGLDMATRWTTPGQGTPTYKAMKLYRNYDGKDSTFGDTSVSTTVPDPDNLSAFGAERSTDHALTVMVINKQLDQASPVDLHLLHFKSGGAAEAWQLTSSNQITRLADVPVTGQNLSITVPAQSITLFVIPR